MNAEFVTIILAAGQGTRMKSELPKVLHPVAGIPMYAHVVGAALEAGASKVVVVVGHGREQLERDLAARFDARVTTAVQERQLGTGDAVRAGLTSLPALSGHVLVLCGDTPLVRTELVKQLVACARATDDPAVLLTSTLEDPSGYGRILRDEAGRVRSIREHKDASASERAVREVNAGIYAFHAPFLRDALGKLSTDNAQGELYLTDVIAQAAEAGGATALPWSIEDVQGVNDRAQLASCEALMRRRIAERFARAGVTIRELSSAYIDATVELEPDVTLEPNVHLRGQTRIARGAHVDTGCVLRDVRVAACAYLKPYTVATDAEIGERAETGPFAHLRPQSVMEAESKVGNFVEMKKTRLGHGSKASHLSYLGDGQIGRGVNIGAGTIFCNYDGVNKHTTTLEDGVFIGSDSQLIAPVRVGKNAYVGTGSTINQDVPDGALALSRTRQVNKEGYAARLQARFKAIKAAKGK
jgi:bifunctional UDP-N-acetylglucosamine pyrophosphorylase / glucosamine-1-phosphate N-acetyltransferase